MGGGGAAADGARVMPPGGSGGGGEVCGAGCDAADVGSPCCTPRRAGSSSAPLIPPAADGDSAGEPPYSLRNEASHFFSKGIPLGCAAILEWGAPPWLAMIMAGHTDDSANLQSALGYGRVFFNCTVLMFMFGFCNYIGTVVPGCIGANRKERIPHYLRRSVVLVTVSMAPLFVLQFFAQPIMAAVGVPSDITHDVGVYCRLMLIMAFLLILQVHIETVFINLGYARCTTINSAISGLGVNVACTYFFVYKWGMGVRGAAFAQICQVGCRVLVWLLLMCYFRLWRTIVISSTTEPMFATEELKVFRQLSVAPILSHFAGWFIFEIQIMCMANIAGISKHALAAGAIWVQFESTLAAVQDGWLNATYMRILVLLGKQDPGARKSFLLLCVLSALLVALTNVPWLIWSDDVSRTVSNDPDVQHWFKKIVWVLALHTQSRITCINTNMLFIPVGKSVFGVASLFVGFYVVAAPIVSVFALTDALTADVATKMVFCVGATTIGQTFCAVVCALYLCRLDWGAAARLINQRANTDKAQDSAKAQDAVNGDPAPRLPSPTPSVTGSSRHTDGTGPAAGLLPPPPPGGGG